MERKIVSDTGPILHLWEIDSLEILQEMGRILIPQAVNTELVEISSSWSKKNLLGFALSRDLFKILPK